METDSNEDLIWRELSRLARAVRRGKRYYLTPRLTRLETYSFSKAILMYAGIQCGGIDYQGIDISGKRGLKTSKLFLPSPYSDCFVFEVFFVQNDCRCSPVVSDLVLLN